MPAPSPSEYAIAFKKIEISDLQMEMLKIHYHAPDNTLSATEMANALGYSHYLVVNKNYGSLGNHLGAALNWKPKESKLVVSVLVTFSKPKNNWLWTMRPEIVSALELLEWVTPSTMTFPNEVEKSMTFIEGAVKRVWVNAYERNVKARNTCILHYGYKCTVCGVLLSNVFGDIAATFIHIHHIKQLSNIGEDYQIDPIEDLRPVCPNCHAIIHLKNPPFSIDEMKELLKKKGCE